MRRILSVVVLFLVTLVPALSPTLFAQRDNQQLRTVQGQIMDANDAPVEEAVIYLKNTKTNAIKTFISQKDGAYRFIDLSPTVDYQLWAEKQGTRTSPKTISSFSSERRFTINLHLNSK